MTTATPRARTRHARFGILGAVLVFGFTAGAAGVLLTDAGTKSPPASETAAAAPAHVHTDGAIAAVAGDDKGFSALSNGHHHAIVIHDLDPVTQAELDRQLALTRQAAAAFPTLGAAAAAGYRPAGTYGPGQGIHYIGGSGGAPSPDGSLTDDALLHPGTLLYDGTGPDAKLSGLMYSVNTAIEPVGFVGTNDVWHDHEGLCIIQSAEGIKTALSDEKDMALKERKCPTVGGRYIKQTGWMMHVWTAPGYDNPQGVFAEENPLLACSDGTYYLATVAQRTAHPDNSCLSGAVGRPSKQALAAIAATLSE
jgi:hypothetical protein